MRKWVLVLIVALSASGAAALEQASDEATLKAVEAYTAGQAAVQKGEMDKAIPALEKAIKLNPDLFVGHYYLGFAYNAKGNQAKAKEHFKAFLDRASSQGGDPKMVANAKAVVEGSQRAEGIALAKKKKFAEAVPVLKKSVAANAKDFEAHYYLGLSLVRTKNDASAQKHFVKVIQLAPKLPLPYYYAGRIAYGKQDNANAKKWLEGFLRLKADAAQAPQCHYMLGSMAARDGDAATAKIHFEKYMASNPTGAQVDEVKKFLAQLEGTEPGS